MSNSRYVDCRGCVRDKRTDKILWAPWTSDGCTGVPDWDFRFCCVNHDRAYTYAIGESSFFKRVYIRFRADWDFKTCIHQWGKKKKKERGNGVNLWKYWLLGWVYFVGVRFFGRWVFAWEWLKKTQPSN